MDTLKACFRYVFAIAVGIYFGIPVCIHILKKIVETKSLEIFKVKSRPTPPAILNDPEWGNHAYINLKNIRLHYVEKGDKSKPLMLFLHGFPEFWYSWRYQIKEFSKDYWTVAVDLRGYGDSDKPKGIEQYSISNILQDIDNLIKALGREKCILIGHDWGGIIALYFVQNFPQCVQFYSVLCTGHLEAFQQVIFSNFQQSKKSWYIFLYQLPYLPELFTAIQDLDIFNQFFKINDKVTPMDIEAFKYTFSNKDGFTPGINYYRSNFFRQCDPLKGSNANLQLPHGLFLFADNDAYIQLEVAEKTIQVVDNLKLERIPGGDHFVIQTNPEEVNNRLNTFFKNVHKS